MEGSKFVDLHIHTKHSDGKHTVAEVLKMAEDEGLVAISITDHDNVNAYAEIDKSLYSGKIIPGIEITAMHNGVLVHILGYGIDLDKARKKIRELTEPMRLEFAAKKLGQRFNMEFDVKYRNGDLTFMPLLEELQKHFPEIDLNIARPGWTYIFRHGSKFNVDFSELFYSSEEAIKAIHECGGLAVLAHPIQYHVHADKILDDLRGILDGVECYHPEHTPEYRDKLLQFCKDNNLIVTGGSDFHKGELNTQKVPFDVENPLL